MQREQSSDAESTEECQGVELPRREVQDALTDSTGEELDALLKGLGELDGGLVQGFRSSLHLFARKAQEAQADRRGRGAGIHHVEEGSANREDHPLVARDQFSPGYEPIRTDIRGVWRPPPHGV